MNITISKQHEGSIIYGLGTGNNKPRSGANTPIEFEVIKVNRKYVKLVRGDYERTDNYTPDTGVTQDCINRGFSGNAGYLFFESLADIEGYQEHLKKHAKVMNFFNSYGRLSKTQTDQVHDILFSNS